MKYLRYTILFTASLFWPLSLIFHNSQTYLPYLISGTLVLFAIYLSNTKKSGLKILSVVFFLAALATSINTLRQSSIFTYDPLAYDTQVKKVALIPNHLVAKVIQNKFTIYLDKFTNNIFLNLDLNNFFFSFHPRETGKDQNLNKYPFAILPLFLFGIYALFSKKDFTIFFIFIFLVSYLSLFANSPLIDFILWPIFLYLIIVGDEFFAKRFPKTATIFYLAVIPFISFDFIRLLLLKS